MEFRAKTPYFYASAATLLLCLLVTYFGFSKQQSIANDKKDIAVRQLNLLKGKVNRLKGAEGAFNAAKSEYDNAANILAARTRWPKLLGEIQKVLPNDVWLTRFELSNVDPTARNAAAQGQSRGGDDLFGGMGQQGNTPVQVKDYVSVYMEGHGLVRGNDFNEQFTKLLSNSPYFTFNVQTDVIDKVLNSTFSDDSFNIATFSLTLKMKEIFKQ